jgi:hypothetical protein
VSVSILHLSVLGEDYLTYYEVENLYYAISKGIHLTLLWVVDLYIQLLVNPWVRSMVGKEG